MIYLVTIITICMVFSQKYQFKDLTGKRNTTWKTFNNCVRIGIFAICFLLQKYPSQWQDYLLSGAINILLFELLINKIVLQVGWFYVGKSSEFDKLGKNKWIIMFAFLVITIFVKIKF